MRVEGLATLVACAVVFTACAATSVANDTDAQIQAAINSSPACAVRIQFRLVERDKSNYLKQRCLVTALRSDCSLQDEKSCICTSRDFHADLIHCMRQDCRTPAIFGKILDDFRPGCKKNPTDSN